MMQSLPVGNVTDVGTVRMQASSAQEGQRLSKTNLAGQGASPEKIDRIAQEFEAQFISQMLENMFTTVDTKGFLGGGDGEEIYRSMMIDEYGKMMARSGGIGVSDHVKREMMRMQEVE